MFYLYIHQYFNAFRRCKLQKNQQKLAEPLQQRVFKRSNTSRPRQCIT